MKVKKNKDVDRSEDKRQESFLPNHVKEIKDKKERRQDRETSTGIDGKQAEPYVLNHVSRDGDERET